jgi:hypothetical protein
MYLNNYEAKKNDFKLQEHYVLSSVGRDNHKLGLKSCDTVSFFRILINMLSYNKSMSYPPSKSGPGYGGHNRRGGHTGKNGWGTKPQTEKAYSFKEPVSLTQTQQQSFAKLALKQVILAEPSMRFVYVTSEVVYNLYKNREKIEEISENLQNGKTLDASISAATLTEKLLSNSLLPLKDEIKELIETSLNLNDEAYSEVLEEIMDGFTDSESKFLIDYMSKNNIWT